MTVQEVVKNSGLNSHFSGNTFFLLRTKTTLYQTTSFFNLDKMVWNMDEDQELLFLCKRPIKILLVLRR